MDSDFEFCCAGASAFLCNSMVQDLLARRLVEDETSSLTPKRRRNWQSLRGSFRGSQSDSDSPMQDSSLRVQYLKEKLAYQRFIFDMTTKEDPLVPKNFFQKTAGRYPGGQENTAAVRR